MGACAPAGPIRAVLPDAPPAGWCQDLAAGTATAVRRPSGWTDVFRSQLHAELSADYVAFDAPLRPGNVFKSKHFAHNDHWMVDVATHGTPPSEYEGDPRDLERAEDWGGALMRPAASFRASGGRVVVEVDVSAAMAAYGDDAWPEIVVTTASAPTGVEVDQFHAIGVFGGAPALGCRLSPDRQAVCTAHDASGRHYSAGGLVLQATATQPATAWRRCGLTEPDADCRDRFRLEISSSGLRLLVNGTPALEHTGPVPAELLSSPVYVYFGSWIYFGRADIARFHWGRISIN